MVFPIDEVPPLTLALDTQSANCLLARIAWSSFTSIRLVEGIVSLFLSDEAIVVVSELVNAVDGERVCGSR